MSVLLFYFVFSIFQHFSPSYFTSPPFPNFYHLISLFFSLPSFYLNSLPFFLSSCLLVQTGSFFYPFPLLSFPHSYTSPFFSFPYKSFSTFLLLPSHLLPLPNSHQHQFSRLSEFGFLPFPYTYSSLVSLSLLSFSSPRMIPKLPPSPVLSPFQIGRLSLSTCSFLVYLSLPSFLPVSSLYIHLLLIHTSLHTHPLMHTSLYAYSSLVNLSLPSFPSLLYTYISLNIHIFFIHTSLYTYSSLVLLSLPSFLHSFLSSYLSNLLFIHKYLLHTCISLYTQFLRLTVSSFLPFFFQSSHLPEFGLLPRLRQLVLQVRSDAHLDVHDAGQGVATQKVLHLQVLLSISAFHLCRKEKRW